jgi:hypothetical protein
MSTASISGAPPPDCLGGEGVRRDADERELALREGRLGDHITTEDLLGADPAAILGELDTGDIGDHAGLHPDREPRGDVLDVVGRGEQQRVRLGGVEEPLERLDLRQRHVPVGIRGVPVVELARAVGTERRGGVGGPGPEPDRGDGVAGDLGQLAGLGQHLQRHLARRAVAVVDQNQHLAHRCSSLCGPLPDLSVA